MHADAGAMDEGVGQSRPGANGICDRVRGWRAVATGCAVLAACTGFATLAPFPSAARRSVMVTQKLSYGVRASSLHHMRCWPAIVYTLLYARGLSPVHLPSHFRTAREHPFT